MLGEVKCGSFFYGNNTAIPCYLLASWKVKDPSQSTAYLYFCEEHYNQWSRMPSILNFHISKGDIEYIGMGDDH